MNFNNKIRKTNFQSGFCTCEIQGNRKIQAESETSVLRRKFENRSYTRSVESFQLLQAFGF